MQRYFYMQDGEPKGPVTAVTLRKLINERLVTKDMICPEGTEEWMEFWDAFPDPQSSWLVGILTLVSILVSAVAGFFGIEIFKSAPSAIQQISGILICGFAGILLFIGGFAFALAGMLKRK